MMKHVQRFSRLVGSVAAIWAVIQTGNVRAADRPNIVVCMTDDQGWGDVGYNGHKVLKTPVLDEMAATGIRFDRFYAAAPVCSPTRGSVMTGRNANRFGCFLYNMSIRPEEVTLAESLKSTGYATGHFGKWHLGPVKADSPTSPAQSGFEHSLSHDNWFDLDPSLSRDGQEPKRIEGESSDVVAAAAVDFFRQSVKNRRPFFAFVCFGSPHVPHKGTDSDRAPYKDRPVAEQHYFAEMAGVDRAMGTLRGALDGLGVAENTVIWFFSDNGPFKPGSTAGLRGKKASLWEGGIRVPAVMVWPKRIQRPFQTNVPCCTVDVYPTVVDLLGLKVDNQVEPLDGISLVPLIDGNLERRPKPIAFWSYPTKRERDNPPWLPDKARKGWWRTFANYQHPKPLTENFGGNSAIIDGRHKLHLPGGQLFDLQADPSESTNVAAQYPQIAVRLTKELYQWQASVERSLSGMDYGANHAPYPSRP